MLLNSLIQIIIILFVGWSNAFFQFLTYLQKMIVQHFRYLLGIMNITYKKVCIISYSYSLFFVLIFYQCLLPVLYHSMFSTCSSCFLQRSFCSDWRLAQSRYFVQVISIIFEFVFTSRKFGSVQSIFCFYRHYYAFHQTWFFLSLISLSESFLYTTIAEKFVKRFISIIEFLLQLKKLNINASHGYT